MPKFNVSVSFSLRTLVEPDGIRFDRDTPEGVEDISDESYFRNSEVDADGGNVTFTVECEDEEAAETISEEIVYDGMEVEDDNGFTWQVDDRSVEVEKVEIPMDLDRATSLIRSFLDGFEALDEEYEEAFGFILDLIGTVPTLAERDAEIRRLKIEVERLGGLLTAIQTAQAEEIVTT